MINNTSRALANLFVLGFSSIDFDGFRIQSVLGVATRDSPEHVSDKLFSAWDIECYYYSTKKVTCEITNIA